MSNLRWISIHYQGSQTFICLTLQKPQIGTGSNEPLGLEKDLACIIDTDNNLNTIETGDTQWLQQATRLGKGFS